LFQFLNKYRYVIKATDRLSFDKTTDSVIYYPSLKT